MGNRKCFVLLMAPINSVQAPRRGKGWGFLGGIFLLCRIGLRACQSFVACETEIIDAQGKERLLLFRGKQLGKDAPGNGVASSALY